jgi:DNA-binding NarL/FixJ family response regulator
MSAVVAAHDFDSPPGTLIRVLIADDHPLILAGIRRTLEGSHDLEVVGEAASGAQLLAMIERRRPSVVLLDLNMPGPSGPELIEEIHRQWPSVRTIVLSADEDRKSIVGALNAGASAYVVKSVNPIDLASAIRQVAGGVVFHASSVRLTALDGGSEDSDGPSLTERERTILAAISSGQTTASISRSLWVSEHTIKFHLTNIYRKLGVSNRTGAVRYAMEHGLAG